MNNILEFIDNEIKKTENNVIDKTDLEFLNKFNLNLLELIKNNNIDLLIAFYMVNQSLKYSEAKNKVEKHIEFYKDLYKEDSHDIVDLCESFYRMSIKLKEFQIDLKDYIKLKISDKDYKITIKKLKKYIKAYGENATQEILNLLLDEANLDVLAFIANLNEFKSEVEAFQGINLKDLIEEKYIEYEDQFISKSDLKKIVNKAVKSTIVEVTRNCNDILKNNLNKFLRYRDALNKKIDKQIKEKNYKIRDYNLLKNDILLKRLSIDTLKKYKLDDRMYNCALKFLISEKNKEYENTYNTLLFYRENDINKLEVLFNDYGYNFNLLDYENQELLKNVDIKDLGNNLSFIHNSSLSFIRETDDAFTKILLLNKDLLKELESLVMRKKITENFILNNSYLIDSLNIKKIIGNIEKLESLKVDFKKLNEFDDNIIYTLNDKLLYLLKTYNINFGSNKITNYSLLKDPKLVNIVDMFIELGLTNQIINNPNIINDNSINIIKRINIMNYLDEDILNNHGSLNQTVYKGKDFYLGDDYLNTFITFNYADYIDLDIKDILDNNENIDLLNVLPDEIKFIEEYKDSLNTYKIGNLLFSRNKVLRLLNTLINNGYNNYNDLLFNVLIYNYPTNIKVEDIEELRRIIYRNKNKKLTL